LIYGITQSIWRLYLNEVLIIIKYLKSFFIKKKDVNVVSNIENINENPNEMTDVNIEKMEDDKFNVKVEEKEDNDDEFNFRMVETEVNTSINTSINESYEDEFNLDFRSKRDLKSM
jgi:hypothetical protein